MEKALDVFRNVNPYAVKRLRAYQPRLSPSYVFQSIRKFVPVPGKIYFQLFAALLLKFEVDYFRRYSGLDYPMEIV